MIAVDALTVALLAAGAFFFVAGTAGVLRFPDTHSRLHALAKADNLGLGLVVAALLPQAESPPAAARILLVWVLALLASSAASYLIAGAALDEGERAGASDG